MAEPLWHTLFTLLGIKRVQGHTMNPSAPKVPRDDGAYQA